MGITLDTPVAALLANKRRASALKSFGIVTVGDALTYYPFRVTDPVPERTIREAVVGTQMAFAGVVRSVRAFSGRGSRLVVTVDDSVTAAARNMREDSAQLVFFGGGKKGYIDWLMRRFAEGSTVVVAGTPSEYMGRLQFTHPQILTVAPSQTFDGADPWRDFASSQQAAVARNSASGGWDVATVAEAMARVTKPRPIYHASARLKSERIHETILNLMWMLGGRDLPAPGTDDIALQAHEDEDRYAATLAEAIPDILPESIRAARGLMHRADAFRAIHEPQSKKMYDKGTDTLRYEEAFICQTSLLQARRHAHKTAAPPCPLRPESDAHAVGVAHLEESAETNLRDRFIDSLPFTLTGGQRAVIDDIAADMARPTPMQRLLQGEVGSGKTVVALAAMLQAVGAGYQAVLVAPTQVLAEQHADTIRGMLAAMDAGAGSAGAGNAAEAGAEDIAASDGTAEASDDKTAAPEPSVPVTLLTGGMRLAARRKALAAAASGTPGIIVATHAAFSKTFQAPNLALVVIDEQHRFGVEQRESLNAKSTDGTAPHLLVMTATPIPRTAAMTWFGDLDISWLTELPGGRKPIRTVVVDESDAHTMGRMFSHIRARIDAGERAYIVCARIDEDDGETEMVSGGGRGNRGGRKTRDGEPMVDGIEQEYEMLDENGETVARPPLHSVAEIAARLKALPQFAGIRFATLTGRDKDDVKTQVMDSFASGETPVLVCTTVIEVGVDVRQASCIVIFDADRYGLSQLHQLRGRVGRGGTNSWAFLVSRAEPGTTAEARLEVIHDSLDGAKIAQADLELRGAGDVLGDAQSGAKSSLKLLHVVKDAKLITDARERAAHMLAEDPDLADAPQLAGAVLDFTRGNETFLTSN